MLSHEKRCRLDDVRGLLRFFDQIKNNPMVVSADADEIRANALALSTQCCALQSSSNGESKQESVARTWVAVVIQDAAWAYIFERDCWASVDPKTPKLWPPSFSDFTGGN